MPFVRYVFQVSKIVVFVHAWNKFTLVYICVEYAIMERSHFWWVVRWL